jgi:hypothetical protein
MMKHYAMKTYEEAGYSSTVLDPGIRWRLILRFTPRLFYRPENIPKYSLDTKLDGFQW